MKRFSSVGTCFVASSLLAATLTGCGSILGFEDFTDARDASTPEGDAATDAATGPDMGFDAPADVVADASADVDASPDSDADASDAETGATLDSGQETGPVSECTPLATASCTQDASGTTIPGLPTTAIGICKPGTKTCSAVGKWGPCTGAVGPKARDCEAAADNDCDGKPDNTIDAVCECNAAHPSRTVTGGPKNCECTETCSAAHHWNVCTPPNACDCVAGATRPCTGASGCAGGTQTCAADRTWGACNGAPNKATYCQDHDGDGFCAAAVACASVCPGSLAAEWKTGCATTDCDDTKAAVTPGAPAACQPANVCKTGVVTCTTASSTCSETGNANGKACGTNLTCSNGACNTCTTGYTLCGSQCVVTATDANNCGGCGQTCGGGTCGASLCTPRALTTAPNPVASIAALNGKLWYTTSANDTYQCLDADCASVDLVQLQVTAPLVRARNSQIYVLHQFGLESFGATANLSYAFPQGVTHSGFTDFDIAPNGAFYAIDYRSLVRFTISGTTLANYAEIFSGSSDTWITNLAVVGSDNVVTSYEGLGEGLMRNDATTYYPLTGDFYKYPTYTNQHMAYVDMSDNLVYCTPPLTGCTTLLGGVTRIVAEDAGVLYIQVGNALVSLSTATGARKTLLADFSSAIATQEANMFTIDGSYLYFVKTDGKSILRTRKY